jgi:hypothetical protein
MATLLVTVGALFLAVICRAALDPRPSEAESDHHADAEDPTPITEAIALSFF